MADVDDSIVYDRAELLANQMVSGGLPFPYKRAYLGDPDAYFDRLRNNRYVKVTDRPYIAQMRAGSRRSRKVRAGIAETPWGFDGKEIAFVVNDTAFEDVDTLTDFFTEEARMTARIRNNPCPLVAWQIPARAIDIARNALTRARRSRLETPTTYMLREACYDLVPECTLFKVSLAAEIYRYFLRGITNQPFKVLDPFAGWGDRALAAAGAQVNYVGVDPNPALVPGYDAIREFLGRVSPTTTTHFRSIAFEEYGPAELAEDFSTAGADLVFSSPPFHDYEIYSSDSRQSVCGERNSQLGDWLRDWFLPVTDRAWGALKPGGCLAYYITDRGGEVTSPLCKHMETHGRKFRGVIACRRGEKRPLPLWVWEKNDNDVVAVSSSESESLDSYIDTLLDGIYVE